jgi:hypothetical protein
MHSSGRAYFIVQLVEKIVESANVNVLKIFVTSMVYLLFALFVLTFVGV